MMILSAMTIQGLTKLQFSRFFTKYKTQAKVQLLINSYFQKKMYIWIEIKLSN